MDHEKVYVVQSMAHEITRLNAEVERLRDCLDWWLFHDEASELCCGSCGLSEDAIAEACDIAGNAIDTFYEMAKELTDTEGGRK